MFISKLVYQNGECRFLSPLNPNEVRLQEKVLKNKLADVCAISELANSSIFVNFDKMSLSQFNNEYIENDTIMWEYLAVCKHKPSQQKIINLWT